MHQEDFLSKGWAVFEFDHQLINWVNHVLPFARESVKAQINQKWLRCGGTWFAGVNVLENDENGRVKSSPELSANVITFIKQQLGFSSIKWDPGQISICYPGYPKPMDDESESAYRYRLNRDAAHVDGLLPVGTARRRHLQEHHAFILGIPMVKTSSDASPLVVWEGSHEIIRNAFKKAYQNIPVNTWKDIDITEIYQFTRKEIFDNCRRTEIFAKPGEAYLIHRLALHGVSTWGKNASAGLDGRMVCYFRPELDNKEHWLFNQ